MLPGSLLGVRIIKQLVFVVQHKKPIFVTRLPPGDQNSQKTYICFSLRALLCHQAPSGGQKRSRVSTHSAYGPRNHNFCANILVTIFWARKTIAGVVPSLQRFFPRFCDSFLGFVGRVQNGLRQNGLSQNV